MADDYKSLSITIEILPHKLYFINKMDLPQFQKLYNNIYSLSKDLQ